MPKDNKEYENIILVTVVIAAFLLFMLGTVIYTTNQVANCSNGKILRKVCTLTFPKDMYYNVKVYRNS